MYCLFCGTLYPALSLLCVLLGAPHVYLVGILIPNALYLQLSTLGIFPTLLTCGTNSSLSWQGINTLCKQGKLELTLRWGFLPTSPPPGNLIEMIFVILLSQLRHFLSDSCILPLSRELLNLGKNFFLWGQFLAHLKVQEGKV